MNPAAFNTLGHGVSRSDSFGKNVDHSRTLAHIPENRNEGSGVGVYGGTCTGFVHNNSCVSLCP